MRKPKCDNNQQYFMDHKNLALQKLLGKPQEKSYLSIIHKQHSSPTKINEHLSRPISMRAPLPVKAKTNTSSTNMSVEDHNTIQSINSDGDERKPSSPQHNLYGFSSRSTTTKKPQLISQPMNRPTSSKTVNYAPQDSCDSQKRVQTSYIDLKQPIANLSKEDNQDLYLQIIKMRQDGGGSPQQAKAEKHCQQHNTVEIKFSNLERTGEFCALCAIEQAYKGHPLIYLPTQQILTPSTSPRNAPTRTNDIVWNVDVICQQQGVLHISTAEQIQKKADLQGFINYLQRTHDHVISLINDYQQYQLSQDIIVNNKQAIDTLANNIQTLVKRTLYSIFHPQDQTTLKRVLPDKIRFLRSFQNDIQCIRNDIVQNLENILKQMELDPFQLILQKYGTKIKSFESNLSRSHAQLQEQFGVCFGESTVINEEAQSSLNKCITQILKTDFETYPLQRPFDRPSSKTKQVYVSFENKDIFKSGKINKENEFDKSFDKSFDNTQQNAYDKHSDLIQQQRLSQTSKFVDLLNRINSNQNQKTTFLTSLLSPVHEATIHLTQDQFNSRDDSKASWKDIQKSPQFRNETEGSRY